MANARIETRRPCSERVQVHYRDRAGRNRCVDANLENISPSGACLQVEDPFPAGALLRICYPNGEFKGTVRYCVFRNIGYFLGVEFQRGYEWTPETYRPQHLLDLQAAVARKDGPVK